MSEKKAPNTKVSKKKNINPVGCKELPTVFEKHTLHFNIGESVYLKTDPEQLERLVTGINVRESGISYAISSVTMESYHYGFEISKERDIIKATSS